MQWINEILIGLCEIYKSTDPYELCESLNIKIVKVNTSSFILRNEPAMYIRNFQYREAIFIRDDLTKEEENFYIGHELAHAILHPDIRTSYNKHLLNKGKLEKQANYFAWKLLNITLDEIELYEMTLEQIASYLNLPQDILKTCLGN